MRIKISLLALSTALLASCAYEGTIVQKDAMPHPFYLSQGVEGKYTFILEDKAGVRRRQMVTPEVYERYAVGQYFNDVQTAGSMTEDSKAVQRTAPVMTASTRARAATQRLAAAAASKAKAARLAATAAASKKAKSLAAKAKARKRALAKAKPAKPVAKPVTIAAIAPAPEAPAALPQADTGFAVVMVERCR
jgi:hypothetical protein